MGDFFTKVEYLQSTGKQYLDTEYIPNSETKVVLEFELTDFVNDSNVFTASWNSSGFAMIIAGSSLRWHNGFIKGLNATMKCNERYVLEAYKNTIVLNEEMICDDSYKELNYEDSIKIFGFTNNSHMNKIKIFNMKIYENDVLVRELIPVLDVNNVPCMYDIYAKKFFYNLGKDMFLYE